TPASADSVASERTAEAPGETSQPGGADRAEGQSRAATATPPLAAANPETWYRLEPFFELASIEAHLEPYGDRLRRVVAQLESALPGAQARLLCLDPENAEGLGNGAVEVLERAAA